MEIPFSIGFAFYPGAPNEVNAEVLRVLLEAAVAFNIIFRQSEAGAQFPKLYDSGVVYGRTNHWESIPDLYARQFGDCKSLTAARIAELRIAGEPANPVFRFADNPHNGRREFHILVQRKRGFEDPSKKLGMAAYHAAQGLWLAPSW